MTLFSAEIKANMASSESQPSCSYCALSFNNQLELHAHCQTESHQMVIMSDEGRDWRSVWFGMKNRKGVGPVDLAIFHM